MLKTTFIIFLLGLWGAACSGAPKKRGVPLDGSQEVNVVREGTQLLLSNSAKPVVHELSSSRSTTVVIATAQDSGIRCEVSHVLPRSVKNSLTTQVHKDTYVFKKKQTLEERRTQSEAPFYTNRFKFTYNFLQKKSAPAMDRQEIVLVCQTEFGPVQPSMDLTIKEINDIFKKSVFEIKQEVSAEDLKDINY